MVETTAVALARRELLDVRDDGLVVAVPERRVLLHDVRVRHALRRAGSSGGSCWWCAGRRSRCRAAPSAWRRRPPRSSGTRPRGSPAGSAPRPCRRRCRTTPRPRTAPGRRAGRSAPRTPAAPTCATPRSSSRTSTATLCFWISSRAFSANSGQFEAGSTTTGSSLRAEHAALGVDLLDRHQRDVLERRLADGHRARQRVQDADLDRLRRVRGRGGRLQPEQGRQSAPHLVRLRDRRHEISLFRSRGFARARDRALRHATATRRSNRRTSNSARRRARHRSARFGPVRRRASPAFRAHRARAGASPAGRRADRCAARRQIGAHPRTPPRARAVAASGSGSG